MRLLTQTNYLRRRDIDVPSASITSSNEHAKLIARGIPVPSST